MFEYFRPQDKEGKKFETFEEFVYQYKKLPVKPYFTQIKYLRNTRRTLW
jgi:hypothetical protein